jgi:hypothetical protein
MSNLYYYRKLKSTGMYKCAGHGAEDPAHRAFYLPFFKSNQDNDPRFEADCILSEYKGDIINPPAPAPVEAAPTIIDLKDLTLEQVSEMYRQGQISEALTEVYIELWNRGPHMTKAQLSDGVIRNYLAPEPVHEITKASATTAGWISSGHGHPRGVIRQYGKVIWVEPTHSASRKEAVAKAQDQLGDIAPEPV